MYSIEKTKGTSFIRHFDFILFLSVLLLSTIGIVVFSSAIKVMPNGVNTNRMFIVQLASLLIGIIISIIIGFIDYKDFKYFGIILYVFSILLLVLVLKFGIEKQGSKSWFKIPVIGQQFQPSELAKITFIITISIFLERIKDEQKDKRSNIIKFLIYSAIPIGLVVAQNDTGTALVFIFIFCVMVYLCDLKYKYIIAGLTAFIVSTPFLWFFVLQDHQKQRFYAFLNPAKDPRGNSYNVIQSQMAIGSGGTYGQGLYQGIQTQHGGVPVKESDFIFSVVGEELGFIGAAVVVVLVVIILLRCLYIAKNSRDSYGMFVVSGLASMMAFHFFENIGMTIGVMPVTGIPLPFVSQGGSSLITNYIAIGIILSVSMRRKKVIFNSPE